MFVGSCVGWHNHRYFLLFLTWMWLAAAYAGYFYTRYLWSDKIFLFFQ